MDQSQKTLVKIADSLDEIKRLMQYSIAIELYGRGIKQEDAAKRLKIGVASLNQIVKGMKNT